MKKRISFFIYITAFFAAQLVYGSHYEMRIDSCSQTADNELEFSIYVSSTNNELILTSYQGVFDFNQKILNNDSLFFELIPGSSEMPSLAPNKTRVDTINGGLKLMFASGIGADTLSQERLRLGKFKVYSKSNLRDDKLNLEWLFDGEKLTLVLGPNFSVITDPGAHIDQVVGVEDESNPVVEGFELMQNYPNPFNPTTNIKFMLKEAGIVKLTIYNSIGEKMEEFYNTELPEGIHELRVDGSNWASGIYFYRLDVKNQFSETKKMVLVK